MLVAFLFFSCPFLRLLRFFAADPVWRTAGWRGIPEWRSLWGGLVKVLGVPQLANGTKAGAVLGCHWPATPAGWGTGSEPASREQAVAAAYRTC